MVDRQGAALPDLHVALLRYRLSTSERLKFVDPDALACGDDKGRFTCRLEHGDLTVTMREHHADMASARAVVEPFLEAWEVAEARTS